MRSARWEWRYGHGRAGADDALASAARFAAEDDRVQKVCIWTPDKDLRNACVASGWFRWTANESHTDAQGVREKFGVAPHLIPDFLAWLVTPQTGIRACGDR